MAKSVLIFESDINRQALLKRRIERSGAFADVYVANIDSEALDIIKNIKPSLLISDIVPKNHSNPAFIAEQYKKEVSDGNMICVSDFRSNQLAMFAFKLGFGSYLLFPVSQSIINEKLLGIPGMIDVEDIKNVHDSDTSVVTNFLYTGTEKLITTKLLSLGFAANMYGFGYIRDAVMIMYRNSSAISNIQSKIYKVIAENHNVSSSSVERNIRHAIASAYINGNAEKIEAFIGNPINPKKGKPTNSAFIAQFYEALRISVSE